MFFTEGALGSAVTVADRACRLTPSDLRSGDSPRELGGEVVGVVSSDVQLSNVEQLEAVKDSELTSRTSGRICTEDGNDDIMKKELCASWNFSRKRAYG